MQMNSLMNKTALILAFASAGLAGVTTCLAAAQPNYIHIWQETVKPGRGVEHARHEAGYVAALEKAKLPSWPYGLAMVSETGASEAWWITPWESNAAIRDGQKEMDQALAVTAEFNRLDRIDAEYVTKIKRTIARARADLSVGAFPDPAKARFFEITVYRLRPGHEPQFDEAAKAYGAAVKRSGVKTGTWVYQVIAGLPVPTFLTFTSVEDYGQFDQLAADWGKTWEAATPEEQATMTKFIKESVVEEETNRFRVDPDMSYVPKETRAQDPAFWSPKQ